MKKFIFYLLIAISLLIFIVLIICRDKIFRDEWREMTFEGVIQNVVHIKNEKGSFFKINDKWYVFSYNQIFEEKNFTGLKIEKKINEEGVWIEKSKGSYELLFYWARGNVIQDSAKRRMLNQKSKTIN